MRNKVTKSLLALCMSLILALGMMTTAFANVPATNQGKIEVTNLEAGATVRAYKLIDVNFDYTGQQPTDPMYTWNTSVASWVSANYSDLIDTTNGNAVKDTFNASYANSANFYDDLAAAISASGSSITITPVTGTVSTGETSVTLDVSLGNYLVLTEGGVKVYKANAVNLLPVYDATNGWIVNQTAATIVSKSSDPQIQKAVNDSQVKIGDTVTFDLVVDVPDYPDDAIRDAFTISDTLPAGLSLVANSVKVYSDEAKTTEVTNVKTTISDQNISLSFDDYKNDGMKLYVTYQATVNSNAKVLSTTVTDNDLTNAAKLTYNNDPYGTDGTKEKTASVTLYTYGIEVTKTDGENAITNNAATFALYTAAENGTPISVVGSAGNYRVAMNGEQGSTTSMSTGTDGKVTISGLDVGTYYMEETQAPNGYIKLQGRVPVVIADTDMSGKIDVTTGNNETTGYMTANIANTLASGLTLPTTGGMGTVLFTAAGILVAGLGVLVLVMARRKRG